MKTHDESTFKEHLLCLLFGHEPSWETVNQFIIGVENRNYKHVTFGCIRCDKKVIWHKSKTLKHIASQKDTSDNKEIEALRDTIQELQLPKDK